MTSFSRPIFFVVQVDSAAHHALEILFSSSRPEVLHVVVGSLFPFRSCGGELTFELAVRVEIGRSSDIASVLEPLATARRPRRESRPHARPEQRLLQFLSLAFARFGRPEQLFDGSQVTPAVSGADAGRSLIVLDATYGFKPDEVVHPQSTHDAAQLGRSAERYERVDLAHEDRVKQFVGRVGSLYFLRRVAHLLARPPRRGPADVRRWCGTFVVHLFHAHILALGVALRTVVEARNFVEVLASTGRAYNHRKGY